MGATRSILSTKSRLRWIHLGGVCYTPCVHCACSHLTLFIWYFRMLPKWICLLLAFLPSPRILRVLNALSSIFSSVISPFEQPRGSLPSSTPSHIHFWFLFSTTFAFHFVHSYRNIPSSDIDITWWDVPFDINNKMMGLQLILISQRTVMPILHHADWGFRHKLLGVFQVVLNWKSRYSMGLGVRCILIANPGLPHEISICRPMGRRESKLIVRRRYTVSEHNVSKLDIIAAVSNRMQVPKPLACSICITLILNSFAPSCSVFEHF